MIEEKFSRLRFPVHKLSPDESLEEAFPRLFHYNEFKNFKHTHKDKIIKYICFLYDPASDLIEEFAQDYQERRSAAAIAAGIERNGDKWPKWFQLVLEFQKEKAIKVKDGLNDEGEQQYKTEYRVQTDESLLMMILRFIRIFKNQIWIEICTLEVELERYRKQRWEGLNTDDANKSVKSAELADVCKSHMTKLNSLYSEFFMGDKGLEKEVIEMVSPENVDRVMMSA